jgi:hypothetical protein
MSERFDTFSPPGAEPDPWEAASGAETGDGDEKLDPREAAALLERTTRRAESQFEAQPPLLLFAAAATVLIAYGAVWLSVRDQHPYTGPSGTALAVLYGTLAVWIVVVALVLGRQLGGRSSPRRRVEGIAGAVIWICVYVFQGALLHAGASKAIVYGIWPAAAPLLVVGSAAALYWVAGEKRARAGLALAAVVLGASASFAGPAGVWGVIGVGLSALLLVGAVAQLWRRRA